MRLDRARSGREYRMAGGALTSQTPARRVRPEWDSGGGMGGEAEPHWQRELFESGLQLEHLDP